MFCDRQIISIIVYKIFVDAYSPFKASSCLPSCINLNPATSASRNVCGCDEEDFDCSDFDDDDDEADDDDCNLVDNDLNVVVGIIVGPLFLFSSFNILCCCCMILLLLLLAVKALALEIMMRRAYGICLIIYLLFMQLLERCHTHHNRLVSYAIHSPKRHF